MKNININPYWFAFKEKNITIYLASYVHQNESHIRTVEEAFLDARGETWEKLPLNWIST